MFLLRGADLLQKLRTHRLDRPRHEQGRQEDSANRSGRIFVYRLDFDTLYNLLLLCFDYWKPPYTLAGDTKEFYDQGM